MDEDEDSFAMSCDADADYRFIMGMPSIPVLLRDTLQATVYLLLTVFVKLRNNSVRRHQTAAHNWGGQVTCYDAMV